MEMEARVRQRALLWALASILILLAVHYLGSKGFRGVKLTEGGYLLGTYLFVAGSVYRLVQWGSRPGARMYLRGMWPRLRQRRAAKKAAATVATNLVGQQFIWYRGASRWLAHFLISWGCLISFALTFPLVLGWLKFVLVDPRHYQVVVAGVPTITFPIKSLAATFLFNGLNFSALLMCSGLVLAYLNRLSKKRNFPEARPDWDMAPLHVLMFVGLTGLAITVDYKFFDGKTYVIWAIVHQLAVVLLLVWLPFSKLFHFLMRPLAVAVEVYHLAEGEAKKPCRMCQKEFAPAQQVADLSGALGEQGISLPVMGPGGLPLPDREMVDYCPDCKRLIRARRYLHLEVKNA